jgi:2'-hydroxyisoflavone reductase
MCRHQMTLLILGGTKFLGRHLVHAAVDRGRRVTLFNRGQTSPELFPELEKLRGNRDEDLRALKGRRWDAVIDTSGLASGKVRATAKLLADSIANYTFVSSISVYRDFTNLH